MIQVVIGSLDHSSWLATAAFLDAVPPPHPRHLRHRPILETFFLLLIGLRVHEPAAYDLDTTIRFPARLASHTQSLRLRMTIRVRSSHAL